MATIVLKEAVVGGSWFKTGAQGILVVLHVPADNLREGLIQNGSQAHSCCRHEHCQGILLEAKIFRKSHLPTSQGCQRVNLWRARYKRRSGITDAGQQQKWLLWGNPQRNYYQ